jgi:hypothetical protein
MGRVKLQGKTIDFTSHTHHGRNPFISPFSYSFSTVCKSFSHGVDLSLGSSSLSASHSLRVSLGLACVCGTKETWRDEGERRKNGGGVRGKGEGEKGKEIKMKGGRRLVVQEGEREIKMKGGKENYFLILKF